MDTYDQLLNEVILSYIEQFYLIFILYFHIFLSTYHSGLFLETNSRFSHMFTSRKVSYD